MIKLKFKCELLTDVILNQKSASEGANKTLDFIPGSNFLGVVAGSLYKDKSISMSDKRRLFHSGDVRFGDAHPANGNHRTLRMPACLYFEKGAEEEGRKHYVHHCIKDSSSEELRKIQLKQERGGFADFLNSPAVRLKVKTDFSIKSAYDRVLRRSKDMQMFGYQSMGKGMTYFFTIEIAEDLKVFSDKIVQALTEGTVRVGRSRSAQYGLIKITKCNEDFEEVSSTIETLKKDDLLIIYAESRLIFLNEENIATFQPTEKYLTGNPQDKILWDKCQIRTFQYAPYNYQRRCFDTDRCGIEKGSVIVIKVSDTTDLSKLPSHLGYYKNEGFGKVIYNPVFLKTQGDNGELSYTIHPLKEKEQNTDHKAPHSVLIDFVEKQNRQQSLAAEIYEAVNEWVVDKTNLRIYTKDSFASQWGQIRAIAMQCSTPEQLLNKLFRGENDSKLSKHDKGYLVHGVAEDKWKGKTSALKEFIKKYPVEAVINLASEMQKRCKKK